MTHPAFDTFKFRQKLKSSGMPEQQAIALTEAQQEALMESTDHMLATKVDINELKQDISDLRQEFKYDIADLRTEFRTELITVKLNLKMHNWMMSLLLTGVATLILKTFF
jgi:hypothetical protein